MAQKPSTIPPSAPFGHLFSHKGRIFFLSLLSFFGAGLFLLLPLESERALGESARGEAELDLCALQKDFLFFAETPVVNQDKQARSENLSCADLMALREALTMEEAPEESDTRFVAELQGIIQGFPIEVMAPTIALYDREIAGLIVGIGKKESNWGKRTPKLKGEECYNFWGYRASGDRGLTPDGYGCWFTPEAAVRAIGDRLATLRDLRASSTPERMVVWKCGSSCATHSPESVRKWISDVNLYYREIAGTQ